MMDVKKRTKIRYWDGMDDEQRKTNIRYQHGMEYMGDKALGNGIASLGGIGTDWARNRLQDIFYILGR